MGNDIVSPPLGFRVQEGKSGIDMTHAALAPLIGPEFDEFLGASIREDRNGTGLSVLSALARLNVNPWQEAANWLDDLLSDSQTLEGTVTLPCEERERSTPYGFSSRRDGLAPRGHRRGA